MSRQKKKTILDLIADSRRDISNYLRGKKVKPVVDVINNARKVILRHQAPVLSLLENKNVGKIQNKIGKTLQKAPDTTVKLPDKAFGLKKSPRGQLQKSATAFITSIPGEAARSYGRTIEMTSTPQGRQKLLKGAGELVTRDIPNIIKKPKDARNYLNVLNNPATEAGLNISDFIPGLGVGSISLKGFLKKGGKEALEKVAKESVEKTAKKGARTVLQNNLSKALTEQSPEKVYFGNLSERKFHAINQQLKSVGDQPLSKKEIYVHPNVVKKLQVTKLNEKLTPDTLADIAYSTVHGDSKVISGKYANTVRLVKPKMNKGVINTSVVGNFEGSGSVKTIFPDNPRKLPLEGAGNVPSSSLIDNAPQTVKISAAQKNPLIKSISQNNDLARFLRGEIPDTQRGRAMSSSTNKPLDAVDTNMSPAQDSLLQSQISPQQVAGATTGQPPQAGISQQLPQSGSVPPGSSSDNSISDPVNKLVEAIQGAKPLTREQKLLYSQERSKRIGQAIAVGKNTSGESGFFQQLGKLKGEMPKANFEAVRPKLNQADIDELFNRIKISEVTEFDKISAGQGILKILGQGGSKVPTPSEIKLLEKIFGPELRKALRNKRPLSEKVLEQMGNALNLPRTLMSSFDLSAPLRQGVFLSGRPKQFLPAFVKMFKYAGSEKAFKALDDEIASRPTYKLMREGKLALADVSWKLGDREEAFMSNWGEKIPVVNLGVKASERAYTGFLNKLRADVFDDLIKKAEKQGLKPSENLALVDSIADFVNTATGRGSLGKFQKAAPLLNGLFFSPRLMASRMNLLNPQFYMKQDPFVRKEALKSLFTFAGTAITVLGLAKAGGLEVSHDPRSADFGKIKVGNTRYDILGGFQQYLRLAGQLITGQVVSTTSGKVMRLGDSEEYKPLTRLDIIQRFFESKESPVASFITGLLRNQNAMGEPFKILPTEASVPGVLNSELVKRLLPMMTEDLYSLYKEGGLAGVMSYAPGIFGVGVQNYGGTASITSPEQAEGQGSVILYNYLKTIDRNKANEYVNKLVEESPQKVSRLEKFKAIEDMGLGETEMRMVGTGIKDGERAGMIANALNKLPTKEAKNEYINKLYELEIMDDEDKVYDQLAELKKQGKLKAPTQKSTTQPIEASPPEEAEEIEGPTGMIRSDTAPITQSYGNYNPEIEIFSGGVNYGTDFGVGEDTELSLPDGVWEVVEAYDGDDMNDGYGRSVMVENRRTGERIRLSHLNEVLADEGELLRGGSTIAYSGNTGNSTGPHVDVEYYDEDGNIGDILRSQYAKNL